MLPDRLNIPCRHANVRRLFIAAVLILCAWFSPARAQFHQIHIEPDVDNAVRLSFYKPNEGFVAFDKFIGFTTDSGRTFTQKTITTSNVDYNGYSVNLTFGFGISGVKAFDAGNILVFGDYGFQPAILHSADGGNTFKLVYLIAANIGTMTDLVFPQNDNTGYAVFSNNVLRTTDGGQTWNAVQIGDQNITTFQFFDDTHGFVFGSGVNSIFKTSDGVTWQPVNKPAGTLRSAYFLNNTRAWACNTDGTVYLTTNGGATWTQQNVAPYITLIISKMQFVNDSTGYAIANGFDIYKTTNSGAIWERLVRNPPYAYLGYSVTDLQFMGNYIWAAGAHGYLALSTNSGGPTIPQAAFTIDTTGLFNTQIIKLINYSKPGYQYNWVVNGKSVGTSYNASFVHDAFHYTDTISLIASNGNLRDTLTQYNFLINELQVTGFTPKTAKQGDVITITGANLDYGLGVEFGGVQAASYNIVSPTTITAVVGTGASGKVSVYSRVNTGAQPGFTFIPAPSIASFSPLKAQAGSTITLTGKHFTGATQVTFGGLPAASFTVVADTVLTAVLGNGDSGNISVSGPGGSGSIAGFDLIPVIASFTPASGTTATPVDITGSGLDSVTAVTIGGVAVQSYTIVSETHIIAKVGNGATGPVVVTSPGGTGTSTSPFTFYLAPVITAFSPSSGPVGTTVTLTGRNFSTTNTDNAVYFGGARATVLTAARTSLTVSVPAGAVYSPITVQTHQLAGSSRLPFALTFPNGGGFSASSFPQPTKKIAANGGANPIVMDIDGDGKPDILTRNQATINGFSVQINTGTPGNFSYTQQDFDGINAYAFALVDLDGDGLPELLTTDNTHYNVIIYHNLSTPGHVVFGDPLSIAPGSFSFYSMSITAADMDGDGKPDILVTNSDNNGDGIELYRNICQPGKLAFEPMTNLGTGTADSFTIADFDGDGKPDLVVPFDKYGNGAYLLRNTSTPGNFSFVTVNNIFPANPYPICVGDIDGDGKLDVIILARKDNYIDVFRNLSTPGKVVFADAGLYTVLPDSPVNAIMADFDGDGKPDIAVDAAGKSVISMFKNNSTPGHISLLPIINYPSGVTVSDLISAGDVDGDGKPDLLFSRDGQSVEALINNVKPSPMILSVTPTTGAAGDTVHISGLNLGTTTVVSFGGVAAASFKVNADQSITAVLGNGATGLVSVTNAYDTGTGPNFIYGKIPVISSFSPASGNAGTAVTITGQNFDPTPSKNTVYFGGARATVTSASATQLTVTVPGGGTYAPVSVATHQFIAYSRLPFNVTFKGDSVYDGFSFSKKFTIPGSMAVTGDLDGDGNLDLIFISPDNKLVVARSQGLPDSVSFDTNKVLDSGLNVRSIYMADMDADGKPDIVCVASSPDEIIIYHNTSQGSNISFAPGVAMPATNNDYSLPLSIGDANGDGLPDIVTINFDQEVLVVYPNTTTASGISFGPPVLVHVGTSAGTEVMADIDGDGKPDFVGAGAGPGTLSVVKNTSVAGNLAFGALTNIPDDNGGLIAIADFDGDGKPDISLANNINSPYYVFYRNTSSASGMSFTKVPEARDFTAATLTIADVNGDGKPDYLAADPASNRLIMMLNTSTPGNIAFNKDFWLGGNTGGGVIVAAGDMDHDGKTDIVESSGGVITIYRNIRTPEIVPADTNFKVQFTNLACHGTKEGTISVSSAVAGPYTATVTDGSGNVVATAAFTSTYSATSLDTGRYSVCITDSDNQYFQECFTGYISEPKDLSAYAVVNNGDQTARLHLSGGDSYNIQVNNDTYQTTDSTFTVLLQKGNNKLTVSTGKDCQGVFMQRITIGNDIVIYPNPFVAAVQIDVGASTAPRGTVEIVDVMGRSVFKDDIANDYGKLNMDLSRLASGLYVVKLTMDNQQSVYKLWKK